jgi:putative ABC transport system permease protein
MFTEEETGRDAKLAVLSNGFWTRRFAREPAIFGRRIQLNGEAFEVIGALPAGFQYPSQDFDLLTPLFLSPEERQSPMHFYYRAVGRLKAGISAQQAQAETSAIAARLSDQRVRVSSATPSQDGTLVEPLLYTNVGQFRTTLYVLLAAVGCLLLIGCINLGGLFVVRASARTHEFAIRAALGASKWRLRLQTFAEVLPLSLVGAAAGILLAWALLKVLVRWLPPNLPRLETVGLYWPVLAFALGVSVLVVLLAGMLPARLAARVLSASSATSMPAVSKTIQARNCTGRARSSGWNCRGGSIASASQSRPWVSRSPSLPLSSNRFKKKTRISRSTMCVRWRTGSIRACNRAIC